MTTPETTGELMDLWSIQESLLQSYRSLFITVQSIIVAVAAVVTDQPGSALFLVALGIVLLVAWHQVCRDRAEDVSFAQWLVLQSERGVEIPSPLDTFKQFQDGKTITFGNRQVWRTRQSKGSAKATGSRDIEFDKMLQSKTRKWMESRLPIAFLILWVLVAGLTIRAWNERSNRPLQPTSGSRVSAIQIG